MEYQEYQQYLGLKNEMYEHFMHFIDDEENIDTNFDELNANLKKSNYLESPDEFKTILYLISGINKNHHRSSTHFEKIKRFFSNYEEYIKQNFTTKDLIQIFQKNMQILHFFINEKYISHFGKLMNKKPLDEFIYRQYDEEKDIDMHKMEMQKGKHFNSTKIFENYIYYFYMDTKSDFHSGFESAIESKLLKMDENILQDFEQKCQIGENDSIVAKLIREDNIVDFIKYSNQVKLPSVIPPSIFETNPLLISRPASLIEYAAFHGSNQIFNHLRFKHFELTPSLWIYAIHGRNPEIIHTLEGDKIEPEDKTFMECLKESIKCHHNELVNYFLNNQMINQTIEINEKNFNTNPVCYGFHYYNFEILNDYAKDSPNLQLSLFYACLYDNLPIVKLLVNSKRIDLNKCIIQTKYFFYEVKIKIFKQKYFEYNFKN